jgi:hypothetical protein
MDEGGDMLNRYHLILLPPSLRPFARVNTYPHDHDWYFHAKAQRAQKAMYYYVGNTSQIGHHFAPEK